MTREEIEAWVAHRANTLNRHDVAGLTRLFASDCVVDSPTAGGTVRGLTAVQEIDRAWTSGFPDVTFKTSDLLIDSDRLAWTVTASGTDTGGFMRLPPTGRSFELPIVFFTVLRDGLIVSERRIYDFTGMLVQIGILKARPSGETVPAADAHVSPSALPQAANATAPDRETIRAMLASRARAWADRDSRALADQHAPDCVMDSHLAGRVQGTAQIRNLYAAWFAAFPDSKITTDEVTIDGSRVAELSTMSGTDTGGFLGLPPTRKPFRLRSAWLYTLHDGQFVRVQPIYDFTGMLVQIGVVKAKPQ